LIIACINYINLSTAKAAQRIKEVGLRKVIGAYRWQLIFQFLTESFIINALAVIIAITIIQLTATPFNRLIGKELFTLAMFDLEYVEIILIIFLCCIIISGIYPSVVLSIQNPVTALKNISGRSGKRVLLRNILVGIQFIASIILITGIYAVSNQLSYMNRLDLGFEKEQILTLNIPRNPEYLNRVESFKQSLLMEPEVLYATSSNSIPGKGTPIGQNFDRISKTDQSSESFIRLFPFISVDPDYLNTFDIKLIQGRNFMQDEALDHDAVILNEQAVKDLGFENSEEAVGAFIQWTDWNATLRVIGVIKDYFHEAPKWGIGGIILQNGGYAGVISDLNAIRRPGEFLSLKLKIQEMQSTVCAIQAEWDRAFPEIPFDYFFLDEEYNLQYGEDQQLGKIFGIFSLIAVIIACVGLFGLTLYSMLRRTKEIGIRKVMGAPIPNILRLLTKESFVLLIIASLIAFPVAYWRINIWLENYANRIEITPWLFIVPIVIVLLIALAIVAFQTIKTALANPVEALRYE